MSEPVVPQREETKPPSARWGRWLVWLFIVAIIGLLGWGLGRQEAGALIVGEPAPTFVLEYFDGYEWEGAEARSLEAYQGNIVVLNFWASWCVPCHDEAEVLEETWKAYEEKGVVFLGVAYADVESKSVEFLTDYEITYPNALDIGRDASYAYQITGVPETFFIDKEGNLFRHVAGPVTQEELRNTIEAMLAE